MVTFLIGLGIALLAYPRYARWVTLVFASLAIVVLWVAVPLTVGVENFSCGNLVWRCYFEFGGVAVLPLLLIATTARPFSLATR